MLASVRAKVVHCRREPYDVYIGRPGPWGNPFVVGRDGTRGEVIAKYEEWLINQRPDLFKALHELRGKVLGCWCAPLPCHGDVLLRLANHEMQRGQETGPQTAQEPPAGPAAPVTQPSP